MSVSSEKVPELIAIYGTSTSLKNVICLKGAYTWNAFSQTLKVASKREEEYIYSNNNILLVSPNDTITFKNSQVLAECRRFQPVTIKYTNQKGEVFDAEYESSIVDNRSVDVKAPSEEGQYIYDFDIDYFEKGDVEYRIKIVVSSEPDYNIESLMQYVNTVSTDETNIYSILNTLPYSKGINGISVSGSPNPTTLTIYYDEIVVDRESLIKNVISLFVLIPKLDYVDYVDNNNYYSFSKLEIEKRCGRSVSEYAHNEKLWEAEVFYNEYRTTEEELKYTILTAIFDDNFLVLSGEKQKSLVIDTDSFSKAKDIIFSNITLDKAFSDLKEKVYNIYAMSYQDYKDFHRTDGFIGLEIITIDEDEEAISLESEEKKEDNTSALIDTMISGEDYSNKTILDVIIIKDKKESHIEYIVDYIDNRWHIIPIKK